MPGPTHEPDRYSIPVVANRGTEPDFWPDLIRTADRAAALRKILRRFAPQLEWIELRRGNEVDALPAARPSAHSTRQRSATVSGTPAWTVAVALGPMAPDDLTGQVAMSVEAWRHAREEVERSEARLIYRSRELSMLQSLGQAAAKASNLDELFRSTVEVLHRGQELELSLAAHVGDAGARRMTVYAARPVSSGYVEELCRRACGFLGWPPASVAWTTVEIQPFDRARGQIDRFREDDFVLLPMMRRGRPAACLVVVPERNGREGQLRMFYGANNQLTLHFDRILTVREAEQDRFRSIVDSMPQGVLLVDAGLEILQSNVSARRMLAAVDLPSSGSLQPALDRLGLEGLIQGVSDGSSLLAEGEARPAQDRTWSVTVSPLLGRGGELEQMLFVLGDVSEQRKLQVQLAQSEKMSSLGQMISGVAHELNNPLASILGYTQLLRAGGDPEKVQDRLEILSREAERCRKIVRNLLSFARRHEPERTILSMNQVVRDVFALLQHQMGVENVEILSDLDRDLPAIEGDRHELQQVLVNLMTNARQAIQSTGTPGTISVRTRCSGKGRIAVDVEDDGPGISPEVRSRIFDPFFTTKPSGQGTGLGLSLVYGIVSAHKGTIRVSAGRRGGACFEINFPVGDTPGGRGEG